MSERLLEKRIKRNFDYGKTTRFGVGGKVGRFFIAKNEKELIAIIKYANNNQLPFIVVGEGTNLVFRDGPLDILVIRNQISGIKRLSKYKYEGGAGENWTKLISYFNSLGLAGGENTYGIPGSVGGAITGNAGCYGQETKDIIHKVKVFDGKQIYWLTNKQCEFKYRSSIFKINRHLTILKAVFSFKNHDDPLLLKGASQKIIKIRNKKFPRSMRCAGSYFKNIIVADQRKNIQDMLLNKFSDKIKGEKLAAAALIEAVGFKGKKLGKIQVADYHGNLLLNIGKGCAKDIIMLADLIKAEVFKKFGIKLEEEVRII